MKSTQTCQSSLQISSYIEGRTYEKGRKVSSVVNANSSNTQCATLVLVVKGIWRMAIAQPSLCRKVVIFCTAITELLLIAHKYDKSRSSVKIMVKVNEISICNASASHK